ncbi:GTPase HflX [Fundidesulfovibrio magnetotacticus]|uniref:GTPase HflX n=1 Tax=Fundidesulfovibrio magnetotacticus TaxID=2730080 RepID=A0A6V8LJL6_9BACT|nr:GTPase HflX [Fundidesulfovibrio magnetotacticus]GFK92913.1 GTPase HflX [Fundidesulfovibrio magnetotacticus]
MVLVGEPHAIFIPELPRARLGQGRLRGLRLLHTHLHDAGLDQEDLTDMLFLRLDSVAALTVDHMASPARLHVAHLVPKPPQDGAGKPWTILPPVPWERSENDFAALTQALEDEFARLDQPVAGESESGRSGRAVLVSVGNAPRLDLEASMDELEALARTAGLTITGRVVQRVAQVNPRTIIGKGKLSDLEIMALSTGAAVLLFDGELTPAQMRTLADLTERKILDRTQLILDIFAQRATSRSGKLQVEMAQLKYTLPRLVGKNPAMSRLMGGIGGRGPGETKLEMDRRRVRERITRIKRELADLRKQRAQVRDRRAKAGLPIVSLVGYTNAGKSTLLNTLTRSEVLAEDKLFATLDPVSRRLRFPEERELVLTDTVGFIRELPKELKEAFQATLEELESADLLILVADASHPELMAQVDAVESILAEMELDRIPRLLALNKWDAMDDEQRAWAAQRYPEGIPLSARDRATLEPLVTAIVARVDWR